jgi:hypothetical protein
MNPKIIALTKAKAAQNITTLSDLVRPISFSPVGLAANLVAKTTYAKRIPCCIAA